MAHRQASLLTIPCELRNAIYLLVFENERSDYAVEHPQKPDELAVALKLAAESACPRTKRNGNQLDILRVCKQIHDEAHLLALSMTPFSVSGDASWPDLFDLRSRPLSARKIGAIKHLTLTARISHLRPMNEAWAGLPFGHPSLDLDTLTILPTRPDVHARALAEIADLSQSHTLAYILSETLKSLRKVKCVEVRNEMKFNEAVWKLFYRSLVYRLWRWGGYRCGARFETGEIQPGGAELEANRWFRIYLHKEDDRGVECGEEVVRLVGDSGELPDPNMAGIGP
ncbi:hypothetical protein CKM354_000921300 [Cercospora kikuchii]|uniref:Uncharacterized protein n=1 Tax=Cercospora kikuchii TaxID=84275 RepID=A0A9P3CKD7_9PEZI|nr:uncharacterized protein CKM354_000921300 [Cercospora kikuchii]GIZ46074.1 hypothetical protein CKM354_000921300 [Cercospora kikuchii]